MFFTCFFFRLSKPLFLPEFFQFTQRVIPVKRDQLHPRVLQVVVAEVQLPQVGRVGAQR